LNVTCLTPISPDPKKAALVEQWISAEHDNYNKPISTIVLQYLWRPSPDQAAIDAAVAQLEPILDVYDQHLATHKYLIGDEFTLADICYLPYLNLILKTPKAELLTKRANVLRWWKDCEAQEVWQKTVAFGQQK